MPGPTGRAFLYVLRMSGAEDLLKVGLTHDPVARWSSFHRRWFEAFDLDHSLLVETESRADAQALETSLHRSLVAHGCPAPLTMRLAAGGATEWYRGAWPAVRDFVDRCGAEGYTVHAEARTHVALAMRARRDRLATVVDQAFREHLDRLLVPAQLDAVRDLVDAHRALGEDLSDLAAPEVFAALRLQA
ncbi:MAG: GIY-YIG nuclease family protein [Lysobacteraceae bacterium]|nr:MAG: GIY-YIG nuclease family protein [Xanthomonadaceae bacterium]